LAWLGLRYYFLFELASSTASDRIASHRIEVHLPISVLVPV
jgi:hypothetical protein